jgi:alkylation response protein AidB-like acyl-CoA dehydrogenase
MEFAFEYTKEQEEFAGEVRDWLDKNVPAELKPVRDAQKMSREQFMIRRQFARALGAKGWLYPSHRPEYGGGGLTGDQDAVIRDELAARDMALPIVTDWTTLAAPGIIACATEEQKRRFLPPMLRGEALTWQLMTEPEAGTDEANQQTNALRVHREGDEFVVNGQKIFVGGMFPPPEQFYLLARSDKEAPRHENLSSFICSATLPGISIQPLDLFPLGTFGSITGPTGSNVEAVKNSVFFDDVRIHESCLIGEEGDGWNVTMATFAVEHGGRSSGPRLRGGGGEPRNRVVEKLLAHCRDNENIAARLRENPQLLDSVAEVYIGARIERTLGVRNTGGMGGAYGGPQATWYGKMFGARAIAHLARVLGPYSLIDEDEDEWLLDDGQIELGQRCGICLAPGGTPEAMKIIMSRALSIGR